MAVQLMACGASDLPMTQIPLSVAINTAEIDWTTGNRPLYCDSYSKDIPNKY